ncbi:AAEL005826-PA [Aedes aegypti]|uniref:RING-type E3 ubiquitin transferase n=1 Tax=Aedes aegypti TaxID=7159 RepID=Q178N6_AEDAE|nr:AAEL005826-PA [Aedes aegypti]
MNRRPRTAITFNRSSQQQQQQQNSTGMSSIEQESSAPPPSEPTLVTVRALERYEKSSPVSSSSDRTSTTYTTNKPEPSNGRQDSASSSLGDKRKSVVYSDANFSITLHHYDSIISELKCPGCAQALYGPIYLCQTGHSICTQCSGRISACPLCRKKLTEMRNYTLEAIAAKVHFPCTHAARGCTVRLPLELLWWHKDRCGYKQIECFMGKVWEDCSWHGCEKDWIGHCVTEHQDKVYNLPDIVLTWNYAADSQRCIALQSVIAYYVIRAYGEYFNVYQIYDQNSRRTIWTVICASKEAKTSHRFAFELELYSPIDSSKLLVQRFPCHSENDADFLKDGNCAKIPLEEAIRFMTKDKILYYRIRIVEVTPCRSRSLVLISPSHKLINPTPSIAQLLPIDYNVTKIENVNMKAVPETDIIVRGSSLSDLSKISTADQVTIQSTSSSSSSNSSTLRDQTEADLPEEDQNLEAKNTLNRANSLPKPPRVQIRVESNTEHQEQQQEPQQLVRCRLVERQESIKMQPIYTGNGAAATASLSSKRESKTKASTESLNLKGLSKFYNITSYKASKLWNKKSPKASD